jgi:hypothetical protein
MATRSFRKLPNFGLAGFVHVNAVGIGLLEASVDVEWIFLLFFMLSFDDLQRHHMLRPWHLPTN